MTNTNSNGFGRYQDTTEIKVGDTVAMMSDFDGNAGHYAFSSCVVTKVTEELVHVSRPFAKVEPTTGTAFVASEDFTVPTDLFPSRFYRFTTGASMATDNRSM